MLYERCKLADCLRIVEQGVETRENDGGSNVERHHTGVREHGFELGHGVFG